MQLRHLHRLQTATGISAGKYQKFYQAASWFITSAISTDT
jgi:hypothetical protein